MPTRFGSIRPILISVDLSPLRFRAALRTSEVARPNNGAAVPTLLAKTIRVETGKTLSRGNVHLILKNRFYTGPFEWSGQTYAGTHPPFCKPSLFEEVRSVVSGHNRPKYSKRENAFRGLMQYAYDRCMVTGESTDEITANYQPVTVWVENCKTFMRRFDPDPRLQFHSL